MPIRVPDNLPALEALNAESVDIMPQKQAARQDIRHFSPSSKSYAKQKDY